VDPDLAQVRAFAAAAGSLHFGRAAEHLGISQQALSKRVARLEDALGVRLFERTGRGVALTPAGERFLGSARQALAAGELAVAAATGARRRLRIDVWGHLYNPMRTLAPIVEAAAALAPEPGAARDFPSVARSLRHGEVDVGFGRIPQAPGNGQLTHRLIRLEPVDAVLSARHPLAGASTLSPADLRDNVLRYPADPDRLDFLNQFADHFGVAAREGGPNLGLEPFLAQLHDHPDHFALFPADNPLPPDPGVRSIPLVEPTPLYAWSLVWTSAHEHPRLAELLQSCARLATERRWLEYDPVRDWLPSPHPFGATRAGPNRDAHRSE
jgi:DNA-binding transcriptional LysR family regulator